MSDAIGTLRPGDTPASQISRGMVRITRDTAGRGPESARTTIGRDHVLVMLRQTLTEGERVLLENQIEEPVKALRHAFQEVMREPAIELVERVLGRRVIGFMSANHFDPDLAAELFVLESAPDAGILEEAEHTGG